MKSVLLVFLLIVCTNCDINNQRLLLVNNTSNPVYYRLLTDTVLNKDHQLYKADAYDTVRPNFAMGGEGAWEYAINQNSKDSTLHIYIFNNDNISDCTIRDNICHRKGFNLDELDSLNWVITYPDDFKVNVVDY